MRPLPSTAPRRRWLRFLALRRLRTGRPSLRGEGGMATSEYATGVVGAGCIGGLLWLLVDNGFFDSIIKSILDAVRMLEVVGPFPHPFGLL